MIFDTIYHEARRRFAEIFNSGGSVPKLAPAQVKEVSGEGPTIALSQNTLNRNPLSTLATLSGIHPFLGLLFAKFGERLCPKCRSRFEVHTEDEIVELIGKATNRESAVLKTHLVKNAYGGHKTLLNLLVEQFGTCYG